MWLEKKTLLRLKAMLSMFLGVLLVACTTEKQVILTTDISDLNLPEYNALIKEIGYQSDNRARADNIMKEYAGEQGGITFLGSSTIAYWPDLPAYFPEYNVRNAGIGAISLLHVIAYGEKLIFSHSPGIIVLYIGDNDAFRYDVGTFKHYFDCFKANLFHRLPNAALIVLSVKYSPVRLDKKEYYEKINKYYAGQKDVIYVDFTSDMLPANNSYFREDGLHLNETGYQLIKSELIPIFDYLYRTDGKNLH